ncbi:MAG: peptidoglycan synthetase [Bacteroidales bacterium]|nr:peptidoglycan synthetase [Bacteroidales bacterium]
MRIHFIAIGGAAMHNLAINLHTKGYNVTGSDDEVFEPSRSRLARYGLLPESAGWFPEKIDSDIDVVILGMHAREDNPELIRARHLNLKIYSYPDFLYEKTKNKKRVVIGGSHGKTTITSMIMFVLKHLSVPFDYMVGSQVEGFDTMVDLNENTNLAVFEGDEYLASPLDKRPKFHIYKPHIALISGIAWDHINVFPTFEIYKEQFRIFIDCIQPEGSLVYFDGDPELKEIIKRSSARITKIAYSAPEYSVNKGKVSIHFQHKDVPLQVFGDHNMQNLAGAKTICNLLGIPDDQFYEAIQHFKGSSKRLQVLAENINTSVYLDFAHSPSKLKASTKAVKDLYPDRSLVACFELHTFSSLNKKFLELYNGTMDETNLPIVYYSPDTVKHKKLEEIKPEEIKKAFNHPGLQVFTDAEKLYNYLSTQDWKGRNLLLMSSGNFSGMGYQQLAESIIK